MIRGHVRYMSVGTLSLRRPFYMHKSTGLKKCEVHPQALRAQAKPWRKKHSSKSVHCVPFEADGPLVVP